MSGDDFSNPRSILFICNVGWFFISHRLALAQEAVRRGIRVHLACRICSDDELNTLTEAGIEVHQVQLARASSGIVGDMRLMGNLYRIIRSVRPSLVHCVTIKPVVYGAIAARLAGVPKIVCAISGLGYVFADGDRGAGLRRMVIWLYRIAMSSNRVVAIFQNPSDQRIFIDHGLVPAHRTVLIYGAGVDLDEFAFRSQPPQPPVRVMLPARVLRDKGVLEFAGAARILRDRGLAVECLLAGGLDDSNPAALSLEEVAGLVASTGVEWLGHVEDMNALLASVHIVCLPSYREGLSKALIEACSVGRPVVTTDVPGCRDVVEDGVNGILVAVKSEQALADALTLLVNDEALRAAMGAAGRRIAERRFSLRSVVDQTFDVYDMQSSRVT